MFGMSSVRARLNLKTRPASDPDVNAGRLVVADAYLAQVLYGKSSTRPVSVPSGVADANVIQKGRSAWDIARDAYDDKTTLYAFPDGSKKTGNQIGNFKLVPSGTKVTVNAVSRNRTETYKVIGIDGKAEDIAGDEVLKFSTIYVCPDGRYQRGSQLSASSVLKLPYGTKVLLGYTVGGPVSPSRPPSAICGTRWRLPDTFYLISGVLIPGSKVDDSKIPSETMIFIKI